MFEPVLFLKQDVWRNSLSSSCLLCVMMMMMMMMEIGEADVVHGVDYSDSNSKDNSNTLMRLKQNT